MALTTAQLQALKADIVADSALNAQPNTSDGAFAIAALYNLLASPAFIVWKTAVSWQAIGDQIDAGELVGLTTSKLTQLQTLALISQDGINASSADRRGAFDQIFSAAGGTITRPRLLTLWKRSATRAEKLFASGTGSDASPATLSLTFDGTLQYQDVQMARSL